MSVRRAIAGEDRGSTAPETTLGTAPPDAPPPASGTAGESQRPGQDAGEPTLVAALGDSITAGSPLWDPDPVIRDQLPAADPKSQYEHWAKRRLGDSVEFRNCGVFGERADEIAGRLDDCARGADALIVQGGINDIAQGRSVRAAAEELERMVRRGRDLGLDTALVDVLPWNNGYPDAAPQIGRLNELIDSIGERREVPVLPFHDALEDPEAPGRMRRDWTIDGDHPSIRGYRRLGELVEVPLDRSG